MLKKMKNKKIIVDKNENNNGDTLSYDIQKELEAKFDELFGSLEDEEETSAN